eukprot:571687-Pyramimonas_sp.AAC.1
MGAGVDVGAGEARARARGRARDRRLPEWARVLNARALARGHKGRGRRAGQGCVRHSDSASMSVDVRVCT